MITQLTIDDQDKLKLIEQVFSSLTKEEIEHLLSPDLVVNKLKGEPGKVGILSALVLDNNTHNANHQYLMNEVFQLRSELQQTKSDLITVIKFLNERILGYSTESANFNSMKNRYGVY